MMIAKALFVMGAMSLFQAVRILASPKRKEQVTLADMQAEQQEISSFARLDPDKSILDRIDLFFAKKMNMEGRLVEMHMLMGKPAEYDPLQMLHYKEYAAVGLAGFFFF